MNPVPIRNFFVAFRKNSVEARSKKLLKLQSDRRLAAFSVFIFQIKFIIFEIASLAGFLYLVYRLVKSEMGF
jgi:hypothetical protein